MFDNKYTPFIIIGSIACSNLLYKSITLREEIVLFKNKFVVPVNNLFIPPNRLKTIDNQNYTLANSILVNNHEGLFKKIETNKYYKIKYWGVNKPEYGLYKKIYKIEDTNCSINKYIFENQHQPYTITPMNSFDIFN